LSSFIAELARVADADIPALPRLAPWLTVVRLGDGRVDLRATHFNYALRHELLTAAFDAAEPMLDGTHTAETVAASGGAALDASIIEFLLKLLSVNGCLQDATADDAGPGLDRILSDRDRFFSRLSAMPAQIQSALGAAHVRLLGEGRLAELVADQLGECGVGTVTNVGAASIVDVDRRGVDVVAPGADLALVCLESPGFATLDEVNEVSMRSGVRWLRAVVAGPIAHLGPTVVPHQSSCYRCFELRWRAHLSDVEGYLAYRDAPSPSQEGTFEPHSALLAAHVALEAVRLLTKVAAPTTIGRFHEFNVTAPEVATHVVLRLPRCPSCGPVEVLREPWARAHALASEES
jgi:bacteriocin biosynthesis cyclodehydratase domain-containing protein